MKFLLELVQAALVACILILPIALYIWGIL